VEQKNDGEVLESNSSATTTSFIDNNASSPALDNEMPTTTPWIIGNTNVTDLFQLYRRHVDTPPPLSSRNIVEGITCCCRYPFSCADGPQPHHDEDIWPTYIKGYLQLSSGRIDAC
jgi:hypothetical protein